MSKVECTRKVVERLFTADREDPDWSGWFIVAREISDQEGKTRILGIDNGSSNSISIHESMFGALRAALDYIESDLKSEVPMTSKPVGEER